MHLDEPRNLVHERRRYGAAAAPDLPRALIAVVTLALILSTGNAWVQRLAIALGGLLVQGEEGLGRGISGDAVDNREMHLHEHRPMSDVGLSAEASNRLSRCKS